MKFNKKSALNILSWVSGVFFLFLWLMLLIGGGFLISIFFGIIGLALIPFTADYLNKKFKFILNWKWKSAIVFVSLLLIVLTNEQPMFSGEVQIEKGDADIEMLAGYVVDMKEVLEAYKEAEFQTVASYRIKFDSMSYEDYVEFTNEAIEKWEHTEKLAEDFVAEYKPYVVAKWDWGFPMAFAAGRGDMTFDEMAGIEVAPWNELDPMNRIQHDEEIYEYKQTDEYKDGQQKEDELRGKYGEYQQTEEYRKKQWSKVEATIMDNPKISLINAIEMHFGKGAGEKKQMVKEHQARMEPVWKDEIKFYGNMENGARVVMVGSKVIVFTGGVYLTGGVAGVIEGGMMNTVFVAAEATDLLLETGETVSIVGFGNKEAPASIRTARGYLKYINLIGSVKGLATDPRAMEELAGKLVNISGLGADALDLVLSIEEDKFRLREEIPKEPRRTDEVYRLLQERHPSLTFDEYSKARIQELEILREDRHQEMYEMNKKQAELDAMKKKAADEKAANEAALRKAEVQKQGYAPVEQDFEPVYDYEENYQLELLRAQQEAEEEAAAAAAQAAAEAKAAEAARVAAEAKAAEDAAFAAANNEVYLRENPEQITDCGLCQSMGGGCTTTQGVAGWRCELDWR